MVVAQQIRQVLGVLPIGLVALTVLNLLWVGQHDCKVAFQNIEDGYPIGARAFHHDVRNVLLAQPCSQHF
jgi:hypothetical protein